MYAWALAVIAIGLVVGVVAYSVLAVTAAVESRVLAIGFLVFFVVSLAASAGLLPVPPIDDQGKQPPQTAWILKSKGDSR
jgi:uncharacterized membrane protein YtjA (UPF0391 family)